MGERSWNWDLLRLPIFKILSIREAFWGHTLLVKVPLGKNSLTHSLMPWRVEWCDSGLEWCQLVDVQIFDSFYQLLTALPNLPNQTWQIKITKPTQTKHKKSNLPNQTQQSWTLNWWLSWNTQKAQELNPLWQCLLLQMLLIFRLACVSLLTLTGASVGILGEKDYI